VGTLNVALALAAVATLALASVPAAYAQRGDDYPRGFPGGSRGLAGYTDPGEAVVPGQIQYCNEAPGAQANFSGYNYAYPGWWALPWGFPLFSGYSTPPYGGTWGVYTGLGVVCRWQRV